MSERFARHTGIPGWDQPALAKARVVIAGMGALGNEVARLLALAGVGCLLICDHDVVEESNLSRTTLFRTADIGQPKVLAARRALADLAPTTVVEARVAPLVSGAGIGELRSADIVISCLDSRAARLQLARRCGLAGTGMLNAGTSPWGGEICWYAPGGACYSCGMTSAQRTEDDAPIGCAVPAPSLPASAPISAMIGAWQATAAVRLLCGLPVPTSITRLDDGFDVQTVYRAGIDPTCLWHEPVPPEQVRSSGLTVDATAGELLQEAGDGVDVVTQETFSRPGQGTRRTRVLAEAPPGARLGDLGVAPGELLALVGGDRIGYMQIKGFW
ncbi:HesA/MoeB/ThiF family protein [Actinoplanes sp. CA-015351]|uniref:HesA/MoeB/ThiF family protein n=1 Tax=Actinoplanes sp. CA-015351 TaxID=3239897 RepID=UPI003D953D27